jgi:multicomponent Na+:H+ antiporter subunit C
MSSSLILLVLVAVLYAAGIHLLLDRSLTRVLLGILVLGNATNILVVGAGGRTGAAPLVGRSGGPLSDPLVQALVLTAIVITLGVAALVLSLIHRSWTLEREDDLTEDPEDRSVRRRLELDEQTDEDELDTTGCEEVSDTDDDNADRASRVPVAGGS